MELVAVLAVVGGGGLGDWCTPEDALDVGHGWWVRAGHGVGVERWVTLEVDVEGDTSVDLVALGCATASVVAVELGVAHVSSLRVGRVPVCEIQSVAEWNRCRKSCLGKWEVFLECLWGIWADVFVSLALVFGGRSILLIDCWSCASWLD